MVVESEIDDQRDFLMRELGKLRTEPHLYTRRGDAVPADAEIVVCDYAPGLDRRLPWMTGEPTAALIVMVPRHEEFSSSMLEAATPDAVLARPFTANAIKAALVMGYSQFRYERRLQSKAARLEENLRAVRAIERAKAIVMTARSLSGDEAYQYIRTQAMERRTTVGQLAEALVSSYDLLGRLPAA
ncbi:ANTAR domain-containing protein [Methylopila sp. 73B]|uniref:ANTAR domain-containing response regulator n=1 Tax=Methylopila sp. 73B TaxID=1120792 RepID=UPI0003AA04A5|nr:ANTAR domain-containing protein [Methylopila sp. 73B]